MRIECGVVGGGNGEAGIGMRSLAARCAVSGRPVAPLPVPAMRRRLAHALPPHVAVVGQRHVGEDDVARQTRHAVGIGQRVGAGCDTKIARLRVDRVQAPVRPGLDPRDVVTDGGHLPALEALGRHKHGEVGLAAGAGEGGGNVVALALGAGHAQNQHVLGEPPLVAPHDGGDTQRQAFFAQQRVATIARSVGPDLARLGVVDDVFGGRVAGPRHVALPRRQGGAHCVHARHEVAIAAQHVIDGAAHARHEPHVDHHVGAVGELDADVGDRRAQRPHAERDDVHRAAAHAAIEQARLAVAPVLQDGAHLVGGHPVVGGARVLGPRRADEGAVLDPRHVGRIGPRQIRVGALDGVEALERAGRDHLVAQAVVLGLTAVTPLDAIGLAQRGHLGHPGYQARMLNIRRNMQRQALHHGSIHGGKHPYSHGLDQGRRCAHDQIAATNGQRRPIRARRLRTRPAARHRG